MLSRPMTALALVAGVMLLASCHKPRPTLTGEAPLDMTVKSFTDSAHCTFAMNQAPNGVTLDPHTGEINLHGYAGPLLWTVDIDPSLNAAWPASGFDTLWVKLGAVPTVKTYAPGFSPPSPGGDPTVANGVLTAHVNNLNNGMPPATIFGYRLNYTAGGKNGSCDPRIVNR